MKLPTKLKDFIITDITHANLQFYQNYSAFEVFLQVQIKFFIRAVMVFRNLLLIMEIF